MNLPDPTDRTVQLTVLCARAWGVLECLRLNAAQVPAQCDKELRELTHDMREFWAPEGHATTTPEEARQIAQVAQEAVPPKSRSLCGTCNGYGIVPAKSKFLGDKTVGTATCSKCRGTGRVSLADASPTLGCIPCKGTGWLARDEQCKDCHGSGIVGGQR